MSDNREIVGQRGGERPLSPFLTSRVLPGLSASAEDMLAYEKAHGRLPPPGRTPANDDEDRRIDEATPRGMLTPNGGEKVDLSRTAAYTDPAILLRSYW